MTWINPLVPNISDYSAFLVSMLTVSAGQTLNTFLPSTSGTASGASATTLTDSSKTWTASQWVGCALYDSTTNLQVVVSANTTNTLTFATQAIPPAAGDAYIVVQPVVATSLTVALATVNQAINQASPQIYTLAVYNLAADRLLNFAPDQANQTYFQQLRTQYHLLDSKVGTVSSGSDQGTSGSLLNPDQMRTFTLQHLQLLKTPFGRTYLEYAQTYGVQIWGLN